MVVEVLTGKLHLQVEETVFEFVFDDVLHEEGKGLSYIIGRYNGAGLFFVNNVLLELERVFAV